MASSWKCRNVVVIFHISNWLTVILLKREIFLTSCEVSPIIKNPITCNILQYPAVVDTWLALLKWASINHRLLLPRVTSLIGLSSFTSQIVTSFQQSYAYFTTTRHGLLSNLQVHYGKAITMISVFNQNKTFNCNCSKNSINMDFVVVALFESSQYV